MRGTAGLLALIASASWGCAGGAAERRTAAATSVVRVAGPGEPRVDVRLTAGDPLAAIDALADVTGRLIVVDRRGPADGVELALDGAPWEQALGVLAKTGRCRLERLAVGGRRAVRVVQLDRWSAPAAGAFLRPGQAWLFAPNGRAAWPAEGIGRGPANGRADPDDACGQTARGELSARYVQHDDATLGVVVVAGGSGRLEVLRLPHGAPRDRLQDDLAGAREGDPLRLGISRFKGRWQVDAVVTRPR